MKDVTSKNQDDTATDETELIPDEEAASLDAASRLRAIKEKLHQCEIEKREYLDGWQRSKAEHVNYRKDEAKRFEDMARFVISGFLTDLLPAFDSFDLALNHGMPKEAERGFLLIRSQLDDILKKRGLVEITVAEGETFDPGRHESIGDVVSAHPPGTVAEVVQKGYMLQGKTLRPARVRLSKGGVG